MSLNKNIDKFMRQFRNEGLTFDDVSLVTRYADFLPDAADITSRFARNIPLNIPFVSAAMDTVTETAMAIEMAMMGGIGIIHKNLTPESQAQCVGAVKRHLHGLIINPVVFHTTDTVEIVRRTREEQKYGFSGFPILDKNERLAGILAATDIKFARDPKASVTEVMTSEVITAPPSTTLRQAYNIMMKNRIGKLPLVKAGKLVGLYSFADVRTLVENVAPLINRDRKYRLRAGAAVGPANYERVDMLARENVDVIVVDTAHGHTKGVIEMVKWIKRRYDKIDVVAGNIGTGEAAVALRRAGADAVKVGIGPGSVCTTRVVCGVGIPQITAIYEAAKALGGSIPVIADGGIRHSGDVAKAIAAGADAVMMGAILAGTEESPGEKILHQGRQYVVYRGMGSLGAMREARGSRERYDQDRVDEDDMVPQGVEGIVPYSGPVKKVLTQYCGGLRSALGYSGCRTLGELRRNARFVRVSLAGVKESHPHTVRIMKEAPNYRSR